MSITTVINHLRYLPWLSKAVAVPNVSPLRCLGEYMAIALVIEAFLTLPHGLPARVHRVCRSRGGHILKDGQSGQNSPGAAGTSYMIDQSAQGHLRYLYRRVE